MLPSKKHILFWISATLTTGFLTTSILSYWVSSRSIREGITDQALPLTSDNIYSNIQRDIVRPTFISSQMAQNTFLRDWLINGELNPDQIQRYLAEVKTEHNTITAFLVSEATRRYYYPGGLLKSVSPEDDRDKWFFRVREMQDPFETNVDPDLANRDVMTIFINYRVLDYQDRFIGVTGVGLTLNNMKQMIESYESQFNRRIYLADQTGSIVLASDAMPDAIQSINDIPGMSKIADKILSGSTEPLSLSYLTSGNEITNSVIQVNSRYIPELDWYLIVEQNESTAIKPLRNVLFVNLVVSAAATCLTLLLLLPKVHLYQSRLEKIAMTDVLTGLMNRQSFEIIFSEYLKDAFLQKNIFSAILFDIDYFKRVNDRYGHLIGDKVLKTIATITQKSVRYDDFVARWGGEEFIILLKSCGIEEAKQIAEKIRISIEAHPFQLGHDTVQITVSIGVVCHKPDEMAESFFERADKALYYAKQQGRNCIQVLAVDNDPLPKTLEKGST